MSIVILNVIKEIDKFIVKIMLRHDSIEFISLFNENVRKLMKIIDEKKDHNEKNLVECYKTDKMQHVVMKAQLNRKQKNNILKKIIEG